jgi:hypothetical protein
VRGYRTVERGVDRVGHPKRNKSRSFSLPVRQIVDNGGVGGHQGGRVSELILRGIRPAGFQTCDLCLLAATTSPPETWRTTPSITTASSTLVIARRHFFVRERVESGEITVPYVRSVDNLADFFTKALPAKQFFPMRDAIMNVFGFGC